MTTITGNSPNWHDLSKWTVRVRFRNVGQGDSIVLEAEEDGKLWLGIIDCKNTEEGYNAVVAYLRYLKERERYVFFIAFIVISHPHNDHILGVRELLEYIGNEYIPVYDYAHTSVFDDRYRQMDDNERSELTKIRHVANMVKKANNIAGKSISLDTPLTLIPGSSSVSMVCLSPSLDDIDLYYDKDDRNHLSTTLLVKNGTQSLLLTSDATKEVFERIILQRPHGIYDHLVVGVQIPHHGSMVNFVDDFWDGLMRIPDQTIAAISVGAGNKHGHPSPEVEQSLTTMKYVVKRTDKQLRVTVDETWLQKRRAALTEIDILDPGERDVFIGIRK